MIYCGVEATHYKAPGMFYTRKTLVNEIREDRTWDLRTHWQARVENKGYSVAYFDRIAAFKALYR